MIFHSYKTIFVHIPKAGGTSIENLLWPDFSTRTEADLWMGFVKPFYNKYQTGGLQHLLATQIREEVGQAIFQEYYKFSVVRNPFTKTVSQYLYMSRREDLRDFLNMKKNATFIEYLHLISQKEHVQWKPQVDFVLDENNKPLLDDIIKLEKIKENYAYLTSKVGVSFNGLSHHNKGNYEAFKDYHTKESIDIISEIYKKDIEYFNYEYE